MAFTRKNDEAVSPVIGVILMVAITVILAAVIAAFVFGMSGNITKTKVVAVTVQQPESNKITISYAGGQNAQCLNAIKVTVEGATSYDVANGWMNATTPTGSLAVGCSTSAAGSFGGKDHVTAVGYFTDGTQQILTDTYV